MKGTLVQIEKYGRMVWANEQMEQVRKEECLCLNCKRLTDCEIASEGYVLCKLTDITFMVTRCPKFIKD